MTALAYSTVTNTVAARELDQNFTNLEIMLQSDVNFCLISMDENEFRENFPCIWFYASNYRYHSIFPKM